jgi:hypothetical protein
MIADFGVGVLGEICCSGEARAARECKQGCFYDGPCEADEKEATATVVERARPGGRIVEDDVDVTFGNADEGGDQKGREGKYGTDAEHA